MFGKAKKEVVISWDKMWILTAFLALIAIFVQRVHCDTEFEDGHSSQMFKIDGKVAIPNTMDNDWISTTRILVDGGQHLGFLRTDGTFTVNGVQSGSYIVEVTNPIYAFEPVRVDITAKGKTRARRLNHVNPSSVESLTYPLKFKAKARINYFQQREQWRVTDMLMNPMIMMMLLPLLIMVVLPKLINTSDPETQKEMQESMKMLNPKQSMPDISEMLTNFMPGGGGGSQAKKATAKRKQSKMRS